MQDFQIQKDCESSEYVLILVGTRGTSWRFRLDAASERLTLIECKVPKVRVGFEVYRVRFGSILRSRMENMTESRSGRITSDGAGHIARRKCGYPVQQKSIIDQMA